MKLKEAKLFIPLVAASDRQKSKAPSEQNWPNKPTRHWSELQTQPNIGMRLDGLVAVDFDNLDQETIDNIVKAVQDYRTIIHLTGEKQTQENPNPKKGLQLIFKEPQNKTIKQGNNMPLPFGLSADIKAGNTGQIVIRLRNWDGDRTENSWHLNFKNNYSIDDLDELPDDFKPLAGPQPADKKVIWQEGTRNATWMLFVRYLTNGFDKLTEAEAQEICQRVEKRFNVKSNDYKAIIPDWFKKARRRGKFEDTNRLFWRTTTDKLIPDRLVDSAVETLFIRRYNNKLYVKNNQDNTFTTESDNGLIRTLLYDLDHRLSATDVENCIKKLLYYAPVGELNADWKYIIYTPTKMFNVRTKEAKDIPDDEFYIHSFNQEYVPTAYDKRLDEFFDEISVNRPGVRNDILQALAVGIIPESFRKLFMFYGSGSNGKGTLFKMFNQLFASKSIKHVALEKIIDDQFMAALMKDTLVNISDELSIQYFKEFGTIKSLISNDEIHGRAMHATGDSFIPHITLYLQGNMIPKTKEKTDAINNRLVFIPMEFAASQQTAVSSFSEQFLTEGAQQYLFKLLVEQIIKVIDDGKLTLSPESKKTHRQFATSNDPTLEWIEVKGKNYFLDQSRSTNIIWQEFHSDFPLTEIKQKTLTTRVMAHFNLTTKTNGFKDPMTGKFGTTFQLKPTVDTTELQEIKIA